MTAEGWTEHGVQLALRGDHTAACDSYAKALAVDPAFQPVYCLLADAYFRLGDCLSAVEVATVGIELDPEDADCHEVRAQARLALFDFAAAETDADRALELDRELVDARITKATLLLMKGDTDRAMELLEEARTLEPENAEVHLGIGAVHQSQERWEQAQRAYSEAGGHDPTNWLVYHSFTGLLLERGDPKVALVSADVALRLSDNMPAAHALRGAAMAKLGMYREAKTDWAKAVDGNPLDALSLVCLAECEAVVPAERDAALDHAREALRLAPAGPVAYRANRVLQRLGETR
jgi:tetratricopeptide (TPR) repeat protein